MTNHVHLLATAGHEDSVSHLMKQFGQRYAQYFNRMHNRTGPLWEGRFRSCMVDTEGYLLTCHRYIECNPVRAGMVADPGDYPWSSYRCNALGVFDPLVTPHPLVDSLGPDACSRRGAYRDLFAEPLSGPMLDEIRTMTNSGFALGSRAFKERVGAALSRRVAWVGSGRRRRM